MKIFNWVHRRFNHGHGLSSENAMKKEESNDIVDGVYGGWKGGILAIGTFGYNPLITCKDDYDEDTNDDKITNYDMHGDHNNEKQDLAMQENGGDHNDDEENENEEIDEDEEDEEEVNPLMYSIYVRRDGFDDLMKGGGDEGVVDHCGKMKLDHEYERIENVKREGERERTTLAELFSADNSDYEKEKRKKKGIKKEGSEEDNDGDQVTVKQKSSGDKNHAKKLIGGDNGHAAIHKLNRMMRRMLKRKIHPDVNCSNSFPN